MPSPHTINHSPHFARQLHVIVAVSNPQRFETRYRLAREAIERFEKAGAVVWIVELALGDREFVLTDATDPRQVQLRSRHELWHKESMMNLGVAHLSRQVPDWKYVAFIDADVQFARHDWPLETVHLLQHFGVIQMFSVAQDLTPNCEPFPAGGTYSSYMACYHRQVRPDWNSGYLATASDPSAMQGSRHWHPGYAWAWRRDAFDAVGGLFSIGILGAGDRHMAAALVGRADQTLHHGLHPAYGRALRQWQRRAELHVRRNVGVMDGLLIHYWHGAKANRRYTNRWQLLVRNQYNPDEDISSDAQGLLQLADHGDVRSIRLRDDIRAYFAARNEDSIDWP